MAAIYNAAKHEIQTPSGERLAKLDERVRADEAFRIADGWGEVREEVEVLKHRNAILFDEIDELQVRIALLALELEEAKRAKELMEAKEQVEKSVRRLTLAALAQNQTGEEEA